MHIKQRINNRILLWLFILCLFGATVLALLPRNSIRGQGNTTHSLSAATHPAKQFIENQINSLIIKNKLTKAHLSVKIISWPDKQVVYEKDPDYLMMIASNLKLITTGVALCTLGPDFRFTTALYRDGIIKGNVLYGNLIVKSNGDPNISGRLYNDNPLTVFEQWRDKLTQLGIREIRGNIILDDTAFDRQYLVDSWPEDQLSAWYCAPVSAISFNDNCIDITVNSGKETSFSISPPTKYVTVINNSDIGKTNNLLFTHPGSDNVITINGNINRDTLCHKESVPISNPVIFFGTVLAETISQKIKFTGQCLLAGHTYDIKKDKLTELAQASTDMAKTITITNQRSQNFYAEQILKTLGWQFNGRGTFENGIAVVGGFLAVNLNITRGTYLIADGSGLSRKNWFSADQVTKFLSYMTNHKYFNTYKNSLNNRAWPVAGNNNKPGKVWAKTGSLDNVKTISGYICADNGQVKYIFSILSNGLEYAPQDAWGAREFQNDVVKLLTTEVQSSQR